MSRLPSAVRLSDPLASKWSSAALNESLAIASSLSLVAMTNLRSSCALGRREHHSVVGPAVAVGEHAADRMISFHVHAHGVAIPQFVADMEMDAFAHDELPLAFTSMVFHTLHSIAHGASASPRHRDFWSRAPNSGRDSRVRRCRAEKSPLESCIACASGSSEMLTTNSG